MGITAISGPHVSFGITQGSTGQVQEYNEERGPDVSDLGNAAQDPRYYFNYKPGSPVGTKVYGFYETNAVVDFVPTTLQTSAILISSNAAITAGTALTLAAGSSALGTYTTTIIAPETGVVTGNLIAIDSTAQYLTFGSGGTIALWNPAAGTGRQITLTPAGNSSNDGGSWAIAGRDMYGIKMTETISFSSQVMTSKKAFKYISSIVAATTIGSTGVGIGFNDTFGLPLLAKNTGYNLQIRLTPTASLQYSNSSGAITTGSTATQTATSSDPRGTYASTTASNGTLRLQIVMPFTPAQVNAVSATDTALLFGATHFSSV